MVGGWITQFILSLIGFHWIAHTATEFGGFSWPLAVVVLLLFSAFCHLHYMFHGLLWLFLVKRLKLRGRASLLLLPFCFLLVEEFWPFIFPWHLGYPLLWAQIPAYHLAEMIGFKGLNLIVLLLNLLALVGYISWKEKRSLTAWGSGVAISLALILAGSLAGRSAERAPQGSLKTLIVQANIGNLDKVQAKQGYTALMETILNTYAEQTEAGISHHQELDLIVWPETAYPEDLNVPYRPLNDKFFDLLERWDTPIVTGAYLRLGSPAKTFNSMALVKPPDRTITSYYNKTHLLAFGEYLPFGEMIPQAKTWLSFIADFGRGEGPQTLDLEGLQLGPQICYEGLFPAFSASQALQGAQVLVNATNDSWFGHPFEPYQHLYMTAARAVETRRPLIRSTNTGLSTVVHASGQIQEIGPRDEKWYGFYDVPYPLSPEPTLHSRLASSWRWLVVLTFLIAGTGVYVQNRKHGLGSHT